MNKGFTLVELLVAIAMFTLIIVAMISAFLVHIQNQADTQEERSNLEQISFAADLINRDFRLSRESYGCGEINPMNNRCICISLADQLGRNIGYRVKDTKIEKTINFSRCSDDAGWVRITNENVDFTKSYFDVANSGNTQSILRTKFFGQYKVGIEDKTIELNSQASKRLLDFSNEAINNLSIASNVSKLGSSLDLDFYFNNDGNCVSNVTSEENFEVFDVDSSVCEKKLSLKNANILNDGIGLLKNKTIYYITENGFLFHGDVILGDGRNGPIKRVLGVRGCRGCPSDPLDVAYVGEIKKTSFDSYLVTKDNKLSYINQNGLGRTAVQINNIKRIDKIDGPLVLFTDEFNNTALRYLSGRIDFVRPVNYSGCSTRGTINKKCYDIITNSSTNSAINVFNIIDFKYIEDEHIFIELDPGGHGAFGFNDDNEFTKWGELPDDFTLNVGVIGEDPNKKFIYLSTDGKLKTFDTVGDSPDIESPSNFKSLFPALVNANLSIIKNKNFCELPGPISFKPTFPYNSVLIGEANNATGQTLREVYHLSTTGLSTTPCNSDTGIDEFATERKRITIPHALIEGIEEDYDDIYIYRIVNLELKDEKPSGS